MVPPPRKEFSNEKIDQVPSTDQSGSSEDVSAPVPEDPPMMGESLGPAEDHMSSEVPVEPIVVEEQSNPLKPPANPDEQQAAVEKTESADIKLVPTRRKSKNSGASSSLQELQSDVTTGPGGLSPSAVTEPTGSLDETQPPPITTSSVDSKLSSESASEEEAETEPEPGAEVAPLRPLQTETDARESKEPPGTTGDVSDPSAVKTDDPEIPKRKKSKSFEVSIVSELVSPFAGGSDEPCEGSVEPEQPSTAPESVDPQREGAAEPNKPLPPKRKSKGADLPVKSDVEEHQKKAETLPSNSESVAEGTKIVPTRRKSKNGQVSVTSEMLSPPRPHTVAPQPNKKDVNGQKSLNTGMAALVEENKAKLSPTQRKPKVPKHTPDSASKDAGKSIKEPVRQPSLEKTEGKLTPVRRRSKVSLPVIDLETKDTTAVTESKLSTTTRKTQSPKVSPKPLKEEAKAAEETQVVPTRRKSKDTEAFVEKGKLSPVKRKPKSLKPSKEVAKPDPQHQASSPKVTPDKGKSTVLEKGKLSPTKRKSKAGKPSQELSTTELSKMKETIKETEETVKLSPKERKSKGLKGSPQVPDKELVQKPEESDSQAVSSVSDETAAVEEKDGIGSVGLKESSDLSEAEMTNTTEESDAEKKLSSPEEVTSDKIPPEVPDTGFLQTREEPGPQRPRSPEMVPTDVTEIKPHSEDRTPPSELSDQESNTRRDSDGSQQKSSSAEDDESDGQEVSSAQEVVETPKEPTTDQEMELLSEEAGGVTGEMEPGTDDAYLVPQITEIPEPSSEVSTAELARNPEESPGVGAEDSPEIRVPSVSKLLEEKVEATDDENIMSSSSPQPSDSLTPEDTSEVTLPKEPEVSGQVDTAENMHLPEAAVTDEATDSRPPEEAEEFPQPETPSPPQRNMEEAETSAAPGSVESLTQTVAEGPKSELEESSNICVEEQDAIPLPEDDLSRLSDEPTKDLSLSEYIDNLWKDTDEKEKRYLVLDVPEGSFSQTSDGAPDQRETAEQETLLENKEQSSAEAETEEDMVDGQHRVPEELSAQMSSLSEAEPVEPVEICLSEDVGREQSLTQIPTKEEIKEETPDTMDTVDVSAEQVYVEPEVRILQLDVPPDLEEETTTETGGKQADICIQREEDPEGQMIITADVTLQEPSAEKPEVKVQGPDTGLQAASAEFIEINIYEKSQTETNNEPSEVTQISPAPAQEPEDREEPETLDQDHVKMEKIEKGSEVHISVQEESIMSVKITKEPTADVNVTVECVKDLISGDVLPEMDTVELTVFGVTAEDHDLQEQGPAEGSEQVPEAKITTADLQPELAPGEEDQGNKGAEQFSGQSLTYLELQDEQEAHTEVKDEGASEVEVSSSDVCDAAGGLDEQEPGEESSIVSETVNEGKDLPDSTAVAGEPSESPAPSAPQGTDAEEKNQDQEEEKEMNIPGQEKDTADVETTRTLEEAEEPPQVRPPFIYTHHNLLQA